jgi:hypothetical protein
MNQEIEIKHLEVSDLLDCPTLNHEAQQTKDLVRLYWEAREKMI